MAPVGELCFAGDGGGGSGGSGGTGGPAAGSSNVTSLESSIDYRNGQREACGGAVPTAQMQTRGPSQWRLVGTACHK